MAKQVILAVAGAGKTYHICTSINPNKKNLIIAYTHTNINNIINELRKKFGRVPELTTIMTFDSFVYRYLVKPYEPTILKYFSKEEFRIVGITIKEPPRRLITKNGKTFSNPEYKKKNCLEHYIENNKYYCKTLSELILEIKSKPELIGRIAKLLPCFYDFIAIDEFQDFREHNYDLLVGMLKQHENFVLVGDFYQHSVSGENNTGKPFGSGKSVITYEQYLEELKKKQKFDVDNRTLIGSRRCPLEICKFVKNRLGICIESKNDNEGCVEFIRDKEKLIRIIEDNSIVKLLYNDSAKYSFNCRNWSYSKGDTYDNVCVILTETFNSLDEENVVLKKNSSLNKLYVALTRTKGNLYLVKKSLFATIGKKYFK